MGRPPLAIPVISKPLGVLIKFRDMVGVTRSIKPSHPRTTLPC